MLHMLKVTSCFAKDVAQIFNWAKILKRVAEDYHELQLPINSMTMSRLYGVTQIYVTLAETKTHELIIKLIFSFQQNHCTTDSLL